MKQKKKQEFSIMEMFQEGAAAFFIILMVGLFPLFYQDNYIDISSAKLIFFRASAGGLLALEIIFAGFGWLQDTRERVQMESRIGKGNVAEKQGGFKSLLPEGGVKEALRAVPARSWFMLMFLVSVIIATVFSVYPGESFLGTDARKLGANVYLLCIATYFLLGKYLRFKPWMVKVFLAGNAAVFLLAALNFWGIDALGMYTNLVESDYPSFISTIGNIDACANYACFVLPVGMALYFLENERKNKILYGAFLVLCFYGSYATNADSWIIGAGTSFLVMFWFAMKDHKRMARFFELCLLFFGSSLLMKLSIALFFNEADYGKAFRVGLFQAGTFQKILTSGTLLLLEAVVFGAGLFAARTAEKKGWDFPYRKVRNVIFAVFGAFVALAVVLFFVANLDAEKQWEGTFQWMNLLKLTDEFGSSRGLFWKQTVLAWKQLPLGRKFFGYGLNCFHQFLYQYQGEIMNTLPVRVIDPHNELLLFLSITGIFGTIAYFGAQISTLVESAKASGSCPAAIIGVAALFSYLMQGMVNNPTVFITPNLFLLLGILHALLKQCKEKEEDSAAGKRKS